MPSPTPAAARIRRSLLTGGSLLVGAVGRTDLLGAEHARSVRPGDVPLAPRGRPRPRRPRRGPPDPRRGLAVRDGHRLDADLDDRLRAAPQPAPPRGRRRGVRPASPPRPAGRPALLRPDAADEPGGARRSSAGASRSRGRSTSRRRGARSRPAPCSSTSGRPAEHAVSHAPGLAVDPARAVLRDVARLGRRPGAAARPRSSSGPSDWDEAIRQALRIGAEGAILGHLRGGFGTWADGGGPLESSGRLNVDQLAERLARGGPDGAPRHRRPAGQRVRDGPRPGQHPDHGRLAPGPARRAAAATGRSRRSAPSGLRASVAASILRTTASRTSRGSRAACRPGGPPGTRSSAARSPHRNASGRGPRRPRAGARRDLTEPDSRRQGPGEPGTFDRRIAVRRDPLEADACAWDRCGHERASAQRPRRARVTGAGLRAAVQATPAVHAARPATGRAVGRPLRPPARGPPGRLGPPQPGGRARGRRSGGRRGDRPDHRLPQRPGLRPRGAATSSSRSPSRAGSARTRRSTSTSSGRRSAVGFTGWVGLHGEPLLVPDANVDPRGASIPGTDDVDESMLVVPMRYDDVVVGVITLSKLGLRPVRRARPAAAVDPRRPGRDRPRVGPEPRPQRPLAGELRLLLDVQQRARGEPRHAPGRERPRPPPRDRHGRRRVRDLVVGSGERSRRQPRLPPDRRADELEPFFDVATYPLTRRVLDDQIDRPRRRRDPAADPAEVALLVAAGNRSLVMLPLVASGESIGLVELISRGRDRDRRGAAGPRPDDRERGLDRARERPALRARPGPSRTATR